MRKISLWARHHRVLAIIFLIVAKILLLFAAIFVGSSLQEINIHIPRAAYTMAILVLLTAILFYPQRKNSRLAKTQFYIRQKTCDVAIAFGAFIVIAALVNTNFTIAWPTQSSASTRVITDPTAEEIIASLKHRDFKTLSKKEKRIVKKEFKKQLKTFVNAKLTGKKDAAAKALLILLTIIAAGALMYVVAALACGLACNGAEGAAVVLLIFGWLAIIIGAVALIRRIGRGPRKQTEFLSQTAH